MERWRINPCIDWLFLLRTHVINHMMTYELFLEVTLAFRLLVVGKIALSSSKLYLLRVYTPYLLCTLQTNSCFSVFQRGDVMIVM